MGTNARLFWVLAGFFFLADVAYTVWSLVQSARPAATTPPEIEWIGTLGIGLSAVLAAFIGFYLGRLYKAQGGELPEDRLDANIDDGDAEQGHFSPWSWWPIILAGSGALVVLGLAIGPWISFIGAGLLIVSLVGWVFEYYRGYFGH